MSPTKKCSGTAAAACGNWIFCFCHLQKKKLPELNENDHMLYERLLTEEDQDLFACLVERVQHPDKELQTIIAKIREFAASGVAKPH